MKRGIAVSEENGRIDWKTVKKNVDFAMLCCGLGGEEIEMDSCFQQNATACFEQQIPFGVYWYSRSVTIHQIEEELKATLTQLKKVLNGRIIQYPVMLYLGDCDTTLTVKHEELAQFAQIYCDGIQKAGYEPGIYGNKYWFSHLLTAPCFHQWKKWVIQHHKECTFSGTFQMWQYTSMGKVEGITGYVRKCLFYEEEPVTECGEGNWLELPKLTGYVGTSIVGALNQKRYPSDYDTRKQLALQTGIVRKKEDYKGSSQQNRELLRKLGGTVSVSRMLREGTYIKLKPESWNINTDSEFEKEIYRNTFQIISISGVSIIFGMEGTIVGKVNRNSVIVI